MYEFKTDDFFGDLPRGDGFVDIWPANDSSLPCFTVADDEKLHILEGEDFAFEKAKDGWYDICVRKMDEGVARRAVATVLTHHLGHEVKPEEIQFQIATE